jgi:PAS domain S-box-containing protein
MARLPNTALPSRDNGQTDAAVGPDPEMLELYRRLIESVSDYAIFGLDREGNVLSWNPGAERIKGYARHEIVGRHFSVFYPPDDVAAGTPRRELERAKAEGKSRLEGWRLRKDGSRFWAEVAIYAIHDVRGEVTGFAKVTRDVTERRTAEEVLRESEERFRLLAQSITDYAILMLDPDGRVVSWNEGAQRIKGYAAHEIVGRSFEAFYPEEAVASGFPRQELEIAARDGRFEDENWRLRKDGSRYWANVIITALHDTHGRLAGFAKITRDLTDRRKAEEQARQLAAEQASHAAAARRGEELLELNRRLESALIETQASRDDARRSAAATEEAYRQLDQFAYVASHDLKAPLRGIASLAEWIREDVGERLSGESAGHMRLLQGRVQRMQALIDGILAYSRAGRVLTKPEPVNTGALVAEIVELLAVSPDVTIDVAPLMPVLEAERIPLQQIFMNLIGNAVKYAQAERPDVVITVTWFDRGDAYEFAIADNGPGIPPEYHDRIWGMFQTLAPRDTVEGTGIGLSVVKKIVESRGGHVSVQSSPGNGATFRFSWPKSPVGVGV